MDDFYAGEQDYRGRRRTQQWDKKLHFNRPRVFSSAACWEEILLPKTRRWPSVSWIRCRRRGIRRFATGSEGGVQGQLSILHQRLNNSRRGEDEGRSHTSISRRILEKYRLYASRGSLSGFGRALGPVVPYQQVTLEQASLRIDIGRDRQGVEIAEGIREQSDIIPLRPSQTWSITFLSR